ncbi:MAG TPA: DUF5329 domain-containing protein [Luteimonas sp.]|nr:DUF5329 domain-containing protein [Luteimonas sp.]HRO28034.1 DUF5329 domain-containing protein [Luteimonas sp.]HRP73155.1 DUF5329 domain-containing protein [Luteimonas sp.]
MGVRAVRLAVMVFCLACVAASGTVVAGDGGVDADAEREIAGLIEAIGASGCEFQRNGRWHQAEEARAHLQRKLDWAHQRGLDGSAETFIERAASRSSVSGRAYRVRCPGGHEGPAADWFTAELRRQRAADSSRTPR